MLPSLPSTRKVYVKQAFEAAELFGFETRNKYRVSDEHGREIGFVAEQQKSVFGFLLRQWLGHWRSFELHFFDPERRLAMVAKHPFRWFFQRLELSSGDGRAIGVIEREFAIFSKKFRVEDARGRILMRVSSPFWRIWTFAMTIGGRERARISKKWTGFGAEIFTDKDTFLVEFLDPAMSSDEKALAVAAAVHVDLLFFESKGRGGVLDVFD